LAGAACLLLPALLGVIQTVDEVHSELFPATTKTGELTAAAKAGQTFVTEYAGLYSVEVRLGDYNRENTGPLTFHLLSSPSATEDIVTITIDAGDVEDAYHTFQFAPLCEPAGRSLYFYLEAPQATPGNAITVWGTAEDAYPDGKAVLQGLDRSVQDLTFRLGYRPSLPERLGILLDRLAAGKPSIWGDERLYFMLAASYLVLLYVLLVRGMTAGAGGEN